MRIDSRVAFIALQCQEGGLLNADVAMMLSEALSSRRCYSFLMVITLSVEIFSGEPL